MTKKIYFKLIVFLAIINILFLPDILATSENNQNIEIISNEENIESTVEGISNGNSNSNNSEESVEELKQKEELNNIIKELLKTIKSKLKTIDEKIEYIRTIEEYETYPAIRLNVDTPIFGLASITNSKLKIKQDVSATDIAKSYSIRYVVKNNSIKLPDKYIAGIIISTKDVKFDENISIADANSAVIKLMQYSKTTDNVIEFLNNQTNKIFKGYIDKTKSENITEINRKLTKLNEELLKQDEKLINLHVILTSEEEKSGYDKQLEKFNNISKKVKENEKKINNILISNEELVKVQKEVLELESTMIDYSIELDKSLETANKNIDEKKVLLTLQKELLARKENLDKIVENSVTKKVIKNETSENTEENIDTQINTVAENDAEEFINTESQNESENKSTEVNTNTKEKNETVEEIKVYDLVAENVLEVIDEEIIKVLEEKVKYYVKDTSEEINEQDATKVTEPIESTVPIESQSTENIEVEENKISEEEKKQIVNDLVNLYKEFISLENKFYLDNINNSLRNTTSRISDLSKYTKSDVLNEMRYIYLELPSALENYLDNTNLSSIIETRSLSNSFNKELNNLLKVYIKLDGIYKELNVENIKKNA